MGDEVGPRLAGVSCVNGSALSPHLWHPCLDTSLLAILGEFFFLPGTDPSCLPLGGAEETGLAGTDQ